MTFSVPTSERVSTGGTSDKTTGIALNYQERMTQLQKDAVNDTVPYAISPSFGGYFQVYTLSIQIGTQRGLIYFSSFIHRRKISWGKVYKLENSPQKKGK